MHAPSNSIIAMTPTKACTNAHAICWLLCQEWFAAAKLLMAAVLKFKDSARIDAASLCANHAMSLPFHWITLTKKCRMMPIWAWQLWLPLNQWQSQDWLKLLSTVVMTMAMATAEPTPVFNNHQSKVTSIKQKFVETCFCQWSGLFFGFIALAHCCQTTNCVKPALVFTRVWFVCRGCL